MTPSQLSSSYRDFGSTDRSVCSAQHRQLENRHRNEQFFDGSDFDDFECLLSSSSPLSSAPECVPSCCSRSASLKAMQTSDHAAGPHSVERLCQRIKNLHLPASTATTVAVSGLGIHPPPPLPAIPQHDWRILQRMAQTRRDLSRRTALANAAHESWQREQRDRHMAAEQRAEHIARLAAESRDAHRRRFVERRQALWHRDHSRTRAQRAELLYKADRVADRLDGVRFARACRMEDKHDAEAVRLTEAEWRRDQQDAQRKQRNVDCAAQQAERLQVAQQTRDYRTAMRRQRAADVNEAEAAAHALRLRAVQWQQRDEADRTQRRIVEHELRGGDFVRGREDRMRAQRSRAFWTGELREMVRQNVWWPDDAESGATATAREALCHRVVVAK